MIWLDSSFAVEWLAGTDRARRIKMPHDSLGILSIQYAEVFVFFLKQGFDLEKIARELEPLELKHPEKIHLQIASKLYFEARRSTKSKASLADAILAAVAHHSREPILAFDQEFADLGLWEKSGIWRP